MVHEQEENEEKPANNDDSFEDLEDIIEFVRTGQPSVAERTETKAARENVVLPPIQNIPASNSAENKIGDEPLSFEASLREVDHEVRDVVILKKTQNLLNMYSAATFDAVFSRLAAAKDLDAEVAVIGAEFEVAESQPGPSRRPEARVTSPNMAEAAAFLGNEAERAILTNLCQIFPDADPSHVAELINASNQKDISRITEVMINRGYKKLRVRLDKENKERRRKHFLGVDQQEDLDVAEFLRIYPNPEQYFMSDQRQTSKLYIEHAKTFLMNQFKDMREDFFERLLETHGNRLLPTFTDIMKADTRSIVDRRSKRKVFPFPQFLSLRNFRQTDVEYPDQLDEAFFREVQYCLNADVIKVVLERRTADRQEKVDRARQSGDLVECVVCLKDDLLVEEMVKCDGANEQHAFCRECVKQHAETQIGDGAHFVRCMADGCEAGRLTLDALHDVLQGRTLQLLVRRSQQDELRAANLVNMDSCPFCDFAMIIDNEQERLFRCLNPDCLRESCRECHQPSHIPLRCDEVERDEETQMRTFVENRMAEAMIRKCPKCQKPIIKSDGCNKMYCPCGVSFCYVCNEKLSSTNPYRHFESGKCPQATPTEQIHAEAAKKAGEEAKQKFKKSNPALQTRKEKEVDVSKLVDDVRDGARRDAPFDAGAWPQINFGFVDALNQVARIRYDINLPPLPPVPVYRPFMNPVPPPYAVSNELIEQRRTQAEIDRLRARMAQVHEAQLLRHLTNEEAVVERNTARVQAAHEIGQQRVGHYFFGRAAEPVRLRPMPDEPARQRDVTARGAESQVEGNGGQLQNRIKDLRDRLKVANASIEARTAKREPNHQLLTHIRQQQARRDNHERAEIERQNRFDMGALDRLINEMEQSRMLYTNLAAVDDILRRARDLRRNAADRTARVEIGTLLRDWRTVNADMIELVQRRIQRCRDRAAALDRLGDYHTQLDLLDQAMDAASNSGRFPMAPYGLDRLNAIERELVGLEERGRMPSLPIFRPSDYKFCTVENPRIPSSTELLKTTVNLLQSPSKRPKSAASKQQTEADEQDMPLMKKQKTLAELLDEQFAATASLMDDNTEDMPHSTVELIEDEDNERQRIIDGVMEYFDDSHNTSGVQPARKGSARYAVMPRSTVELIEGEDEEQHRVIDGLMEYFDDNHETSGGQPVQQVDKGSGLHRAKNGESSEQQKTTKTVSLQEVEVMRAKTDKLNVDLRVAQQRLAKAPMGESRAALSEVRRLLNERDESLKTVQDLEAAMLRQGATEQDIGRRDDSQLRLSQQEIEGAAVEAERLARETTARREEQLRQAIGSKDERNRVDYVRPTAIRPSCQRLWNPTARAVTNRYTLPLLDLGQSHRAADFPSTSPALDRDSMILNRAFDLLRELDERPKPRAVAFRIEDWLRDTEIHDIDYRPRAELFRIVRDFGATPTVNTGHRMLNMFVDFIDHIRRQGLRHKEPDTVIDRARDTCLRYLKRCVVEQPNVTREKVEEKQKKTVESLLKTERHLTDELRQHDNVNYQLLFETRNVERELEQTQAAERQLQLQLQEVQARRQRLQQQLAEHRVQAARERERDRLQQQLADVRQNINEARRLANESMTPSSSAPTSSQSTTQAAGPSTLDLFNLSPRHDKLYETWKWLNAAPTTAKRMADSGGDSNRQRFSALLKDLEYKKPFRPASTTSTGVKAPAPDAAGSSEPTEKDDGRSESPTLDKLLKLLKDDIKAFSAAPPNTTGRYATTAADLPGPSGLTKKGDVPASSSPRLDALLKSWESEQAEVTAPEPTRMKKKRVHFVDIVTLSSGEDDDDDFDFPEVVYESTRRKKRRAGRLHAQNLQRPLSDDAIAPAIDNLDVINLIDLDDQQQHDDDIFRPVQYLATSEIETPDRLRHDRDQNEHWPLALNPPSGTTPPGSPMTPPQGLADSPVHQEQPQRAGTSGVIQINIRLSDQPPLRRSHRTKPRGSAASDSVIKTERE